MAISKRWMTVLATAVVAGTSLGSHAEAQVFSDRSAFDAAVNVQVNENFSSLGSATTPLAGPALLPSNITIASQSNNLFVVGPGQSTNPTTAIGSFSPGTDALFIILGGSFTAFGVNIYQNFGAGTQSIQPELAAITFFDFVTPVAPNFIVPIARDGGSFFGYISPLPFDSVGVQGLLPFFFEVIDDVALGRAALAVPGPIAGAGLPAVLGLAGAWFVRRRKQKLAA